MIKTIAVFLFIVGVFIFGYGFHNIDTSANLFNQGVGGDYNMIGAFEPVRNVYIAGMQELLIGTIMMIAGFTAMFGVKDGMAQLHNEQA